MRVRGARTTAAQVEPTVVSTPLSNAKQRFQGMADFAPRAIRIALLTPVRGVHARQHCHDGTMNLVLVPAMTAQRFKPLPSRPM
jgi:hypothetical protein